MLKERSVKKLCTFDTSMKIPLTTITIGAVLIPLSLKTGIMSEAFRQSRLDTRFTEI